MDSFIVKVDKDLEDIFPNFLSNRIKDIILLEKYFEAKNYQEIASIGHKVSGSAGGYGLHDLGKIAKSIEMNSSKKNDKEIENLIHKFKAYITNLNIEYIDID